MSHTCHGCTRSILDNKVLCEACTRRLAPSTRVKLRALFSGSFEAYRDALNAVDRDLGLVSS